MARCETEDRKLRSGFGGVVERQRSLMKSISASLVVLAAAIMITGGSFVPHHDTRLFVQSVGCVVGLLGILGWIGAFLEKP